MPNWFLLITVNCYTVITTNLPCLCPGRSKIPQCSPLNVQVGPHIYSSVNVQVGPHMHSQTTPRWFGLVVCFSKSHLLIISLTINLVNGCISMGLCIPEKLEMRSKVKEILLTKNCDQIPACLVCSNSFPPFPHILQRLPSRDFHGWLIACQSVSKATLTACCFLQLSAACHVLVRFVMIWLWVVLNPFCKHFPHNVFKQKRSTWP